VFLTLLGGTAGSPLGLIFSASVVDKYIVPGTNGFASGSECNSRRRPRITGIFWRALLLSFAVAISAGPHHAERGPADAVRSAQGSFFERLQRPPDEFLRSPRPVGRLVTRVTTDIERAERSISPPVSRPWANERYRAVVHRRGDGCG